MASTENSRFHVNSSVIPSSAHSASIRHLHQLSYFSHFLSGAIGACTAATITNPLEVLKTRRQISQNKITFNNKFHFKIQPKDLLPLQHHHPQMLVSANLQTSYWDSFLRIWKKEGLVGLQRGLSLAYCYQIAMNGTRFMLYQPIRKMTKSLCTPETLGNEYLQTTEFALSNTNVNNGDKNLRSDQKEFSFEFDSKAEIEHSILPSSHALIDLNTSNTFGKSNAPSQNLNRSFQFNLFLADVAAGAISGSISAIIASPFGLVKTRMQSYSPLKSDPIRHRYQSIPSAFYQIWKNEGGIKGLYRGSSAAILRSTFSSAAQLSLFDQCKETLVRHSPSETSLIPLQVVAASLSGSVACLAMSPFDVVMTRVYNQKPGTYKGAIDCALRTIKCEGPFALWKGFLSSWMRVTPFTIVMFVTVDHAKSLLSLIENRIRH